MKICAEYIWLDGKKPTADIRGKTKILNHANEGYLFGPEQKADVPEWGFDGSSTEQATGDKSDCVLKPVRVYKDPIRGERKSSPNYYHHLLVLNEVHLTNGEPHPSNTRAELRRMTEKHGSESFLFGIEQEYTLFKDGRPLGFPEGGFPEPQGKYYCGVGADKAYGRELVEKHLQACLAAEILIAGINAEVMPGQWEYQIGAGDPLRVADDLTVARYLLSRLGEEAGISVSLASKPMNGDWNGAGAHTNFSTRAMRESSAVFDEIIEKMKTHHPEHIVVYGNGIEQRLTGKHETCSYREFRAGVSDRGASIRIPWQVARDGKGYLEDRRPCANIDPYVVLEKIIRTVCE